MGVEESRIGSTTFISELVPTKATAGAYLSRSLKSPSPKDLTVVPKTVCESQIRTQTYRNIPLNWYQRQPPWPRKATITPSPMGKTDRLATIFTRFYVGSISQTTYTGNDFHEPLRATISRDAMSEASAEPYIRATISRASAGNDSTRCYVGSISRTTYSLMG